MVRYKKILRILPVIMLGLLLALSPPSKASAAGSDLEGTAGGGSGANTYLFYYEFDGRGVRLRVATTGGWPIDEFGGQTGHTFTKGDHTYIPASHPVCASALNGPLAQMCATYGLDIRAISDQLTDAGYREIGGVWVAAGPTYLTYIDPFDGIGAAPQHQHTWTDWAPLNSEYHEKHTTCGHYMQMIERHRFTPYVDQHDGTHTRVCPICGYTQNAPHDMAIVSKNIQTHTEGWRRVITADVIMHCRYCEHEERAHTELSVSGAEAETWTGIGSYRLSSDCSKGDIDPMTEGMVKMWGVFAEMERNIISQKVKSGMKNAASKGKQIGRPETTKDTLPDKFWRYYQMYKAGNINISEMSRIMDCSRASVYKYIKIAEMD